MFSSPLLLHWSFVRLVSSIISFFSLHFSSCYLRTVSCSIRSCSFLHSSCGDVDIFRDRFFVLLYVFPRKEIPRYVCPCISYFVFPSSFIVMFGWFSWTWYLFCICRIFDVFWALILCVVRLVSSSASTLFTSSIQDDWWYPYFILLRFSVWNFFLSWFHPQENSTCSSLLINGGISSFLLVPSYGGVLSVIFLFGECSWVPASASREDDGVVSVIVIPYLRVQ